MARDVGIQDGQSSEAHPLAQDHQSRAEMLEKFRRVLEAHERIGDLILELRHEEGIQRAGAFKRELLVEMFEDKYGGQRMEVIAQEIAQNRLESFYYQESKAFFNTLKQEKATEKVLSSEWRGRG